MKKRILSAFLMISLILTMVPIQAMAEGSAASITHVLENGAKLTFDPNTGAVTGCTLNGATEVVIPAKIEGTSVTTIGDSTFENCTSLTSVVIPDSVTTIGEWAFSHCSSLTSVVISGSVTAIERGVFYGCTSLTSVSLPASVTTIGRDAFKGCTSLASVSLPTGLITIGESAFYGCSSLASVTIPNTVTTIVKFAFYGCSSLASVEIPSSVTTIGEQAFRKCTNLASVVIPSSVTSIQWETFRDCPKLTSAGPIGGDYCIQYGWTAALPDYAFRGSSLTSVVIPDTVTKIGQCAFQDCTLLTGVSLPAGLTSIGDAAFQNCSGFTSVTVPEGVTSIGASAFYDCTKMESISLPDTLTAIGREAFKQCSSLTSVVIPDNVTTIGDYTFDNCTSLTSVVIPGKITTIPFRAFLQCTSLTSVVIPDGVTTIGREAFSGCSSLTKAVIPDTVTSIDNSAFDSVSNDFAIWCYRGTCAAQFAEKKGIPYFLIGEDTETRTLTLSVLDAAGTPVTEGFTVNWYDESGTVLGSGLSLSGVTDDAAYFYDILLDETLGICYIQPERQKVTVSEASQSITCTLKKIPSLTVHGMVKDVEGLPLSNAEVTFQQTANGKYTVSKSVHTNTDGTYIAEILNVPTIVSYHLAAYYTQQQPVITGTYDGAELTLDPAVLTKLPENRVSLSLRLTYAAKEDEATQTAGISSAANLTFSVQNDTQQRAIEDFAVQYPYLFLTDASAQPGDTITIRAIDNKGEMTAAPVSCVLSETKTGSAKVEFVQNGSFEVENLSGNGQTSVMVFDEAGDFVKSYSCDSSCKSEPMPAGNYTLVFLQKTNRLTGVEKLSRLEDFGLSLDTDYVSQSVAIRTGVITTVSDVTVPELNEDKLCYTIPDSTGFHLSSSAVTAGQYILLRAEYAIDSKYSTSQQTVSIHLPEGMELVNGGLTLNGQAAIYSQDNHTVQVPANSPSGIVRMYAAATKAGTHTISASLSFTSEGNPVQQPIGSAVLDVTTAKLMVPFSATSQDDLTVWGTTLPGSTVTVYDNGAAAGTVTANAAGSWKLNFPLTNDSLLTPHEIYAKIDSGISEAFVTDTETVLYSGDYAQVSKITMINTAHDASSLNPVEYVCEFDYLNPGGATPQYWYWPDYPTFTFKLEFADGVTGNDIYGASIITTDANGNETEVPLTYDAGSGIWLGTHDYSSYNLPVKVSASYRTASNPQEIWEDYQSTANLENWTFTESSDKKRMICTFDSGNDFDEYKQYSVFFIPFDSEEEKLAYLNRRDLQLECVYEDSDTVIYIPTYVTIGKSTFYSYAKNSKLQYLQVSEWSYDIVIASAALFSAGCGCTNGLINSNTRAARQYNIMYQLKNCSCIGDLDEPMRDQFLRQLGLTDNLGKIAILTPPISEALNPSFNFGDLIQNLGMNMLNNSPNMPHPADGVINNYNANLGTISAAERWLSGSSQGGSSRTLLRAAADFHCECPRPEPGSEQHTGTQDVNNALDPSGYAYEAVPSNRLAGVITTLFQRDGSGQSILWDSEAYNQVNPLITNANGEYSWFVPTGNWQVKFEKDGYETAYSDWLPVPPPQTDVNVAMVSNAVPEVQSVRAYPDSIRIAFSQYMDISTVNSQTITVSMNGDAVEGSIQPVNPEATAGGSETRYASIFTFVPAQEMAGKVTIFIRNAVNYAAKPMTSGYYTTKTIVPEPERVVVAETTVVPYQGSTLVKLQVLPADAGAGQEIRVVSSSPSIATVDEPSIMTDAAGNAAVLVKGSLPGSSEISFALVGTDITAKTQVTVDGVLKNAGNCAAVSASTESGTVAAGTAITLTAEPSDAEIYYTLDKTDPSDLSNPSRTRYTQPIILTESTSIVAYAVKSGMYDSPLSAFYYTVPGSTFVPVEAISVDSPSVSLKTGESLTVSAALLPENASNQTVVWSIDHTAVAAIAADGLRCTVTGRSAGNATLTAATADGAHTATIAITVSGSSGSGGSSGGSSGSSASYTISEPSGTQNGTVSVNPKSASNGDTVTITVTPDPGCTLEILTVIDAAGAELMLTRKSSNEYTFVMPSSKVTVRATFIEDNTMHNDFVDVSSSAYYYDAVLWAAKEGITGGTSATTFSPDNPCTRAQAVTFLWRAAGSPMVNDAMHFTDVPDNAYYTEAVRWAVSEGITAGISDTAFGPDAECTRGQIVAFLWRAQESPVPETANPFADVSADAYYNSAVLWALENGITAGTTDITFSPGSDCTRAQIVTFLYRNSN